MDWQSIETAPKDIQILLFAPGDFFAIGIWYFDAWGTAGPPVLGDPLYDISWTHWAPLQPPTS